MNRHLILQSGAVRLRGIEESDLADLRLWKNANRRAFFFKSEITLEGQRAWFQGYLARPDDYMFLVESGAVRVGCMGFRLEGGAADCYNIIGVVQGKGLMTSAMRLMCSYILKEHTDRIGCRVLKDNPAVGWYKKCGYVVTADGPDYHQMDLDVKAFQPRDYEVL